jgi:hypothetical protein
MAIGKLLGRGGRTRAGQVPVGTTGQQTRENTEGMTMSDQHSMSMGDPVKESMSMGEPDKNRMMMPDPDKNRMMMHPSHNDPMMMHPSHNDPMTKGHPDQDAKR